jgi:hypothetical protein
VVVGETIMHSNLRAIVMASIVMAAPNAIDAMTMARRLLCMIVSPLLPGD